MTFLLVVMDYNQILMTAAYISNLEQFVIHALFGWYLLVIIVIHVLHEMKFFLLRTFDIKIMEQAEYIINIKIIELK